MGVSHDCDWPPEVTDKPVLSGSTVDPEASSREVDAVVRQKTHGGRSLYHLDQQRLQSLQPDLILTQELCEVCAPDFETVRRSARLLEDEARVVSLEPENLQGMLENIRLVGEITGRKQRAERRVEALQSRIERVQSLVDEPGRAPRVVSLEWLDPPFVGGHWVPEMIELAGGEPLGDPAAPSRRVKEDEIRSFEPEVLVLMPCGFDLERTVREYGTLGLRETWGAWPSVSDERVVATHGSFYFNRPGPRLVEGLEILASILHPELEERLEPPSRGFRWLGG